MGKTYQVMVYGLRGEHFVLDLCNTDEQFKTMTVLQLKEKLATKLPDTAGQESLQLKFTDTCLDDDSALLSSYAIQHMSVIFLTLSLPGGLRV